MGFVAEVLKKKLFQQFHGRMNMSMEYMCMMVKPIAVEKTDKDSSYNVKNIHKKGWRKSSTFFIKFKHLLHFLTFCDIFLALKKGYDDE